MAINNTSGNISQDLLNNVTMTAAAIAGQSAKVNANGNVDANSNKLSTIVEQYD
ncbi:MAG: hypothetical protein ACE14P_09560 [Methanotrichaceae archaeon]